jgi:hypothetical protein
MQTSQGTVACPSPGGRQLHHRMRKLTLCLTASVVGLSVGLAAPAQAADHIVVGASGDVAGLQSHAGTQLARHVYGKLSGPAQVAPLVNIETTVNWSQVAAGSQDANIKRWASALKGHDMMVSFSHEPMSRQNSHWGSSSDFIAAWKHVVNGALLELAVRGEVVPRRLLRRLRGGRGVQQGGVWAVRGQLRREDPADLRLRQPAQQEVRLGGVRQ